MKHLTTALLLGLITGPAMAEGDPEAGAKAFARQCVACHVIATADGEVLAGRRARTGPNLYGVVGAPIGGVEGFRYGSAIKTLNEQGVQWDAPSLIGYIQDPTGWLRETLSDSGARGKMAFKVRKEQDAIDIVSYIESLSAQ